PLELMLGGLDADWLAAWDASPRQDHRLVLARDAARLRMTRQSAVGDRIRDLVPALDPEWCVEGALLAGSLARHDGEEGGRAWLRLALDCLGRAVDEDWLAAAIRALSPLAITLGDAVDRELLRQTRNTLKSRQRAVADGLPSRWVREWALGQWPADDGIRGGLIAALLLASAIDERSAVAGYPQTAVVVPLWKELAEGLEVDAPGRENRDTVDRLISLAKARSLLLSETAMDALQAALGHPDSAEQAGMARLLPLLDRPAASVLPEIRKWRAELLKNSASSPHRLVASLYDHAILWLGEKESRFVDDDIAPLYRLAASGDDRSGARAQLLLHGRETWLGRRPARFSLADLAFHGSKVTMERLGERVFQEKDAERNECLARFALYDWQIDDPEILAAWLAELAERPTKPLLNTVFAPWRWSPQCLALWDNWIRKVHHPQCLDESVVWLAILHISAKNGLDAAHVPPTPAWSPDLVPEVSWLSRVEA